MGCSSPDRFSIITIIKDGAVTGHVFYNERGETEAIVDAEGNKFTFGEIDSVNASGQTTKEKVIVSVVDKNGRPIQGAVSTAEEVRHLDDLKNNARILALVGAQCVDNAKPLFEDSKKRLADLGHSIEVFDQSNADAKLGVLREDMAKKYNDEELLALDYFATSRFPDAVEKKEAELKRPLNQTEKVEVYNQLLAEEAQAFEDEDKKKAAMAGYKKERKRVEKLYGKYENAMDDCQKAEEKLAKAREKNADDKKLKKLEEKLKKRQDKAAEALKEYQNSNPAMVTQLDAFHAHVASSGEIPEGKHVTLKSFLRLQRKRSKEDKKEKDPSGDRFDAHLQERKQKDGQQQTFNEDLSLTSRDVR